MSKKSGVKNAPSKTGNPSGGGRGNNPPSNTSKSGNSKGSKK